MAQTQFDHFRRIQEDLRHSVRVEPLARSPEAVAAVDLHINRAGVGFAAAVLVDHDGNVLEQRVVRREIDIPYVPGFLSFREMPLCRDAIRSLHQQPDIVLVDGQGLAHPRRFGLACHLGVELELPTIGVAKSVLAGRLEEPGQERGARSPIRIRDEIVGMALRTRTGVKPVYVSVGHLVTLSEAVEITMSQVSRYRLPDPSRLSHRLAREAASARDG